ncbi:SAF domain-containing protein [Nesterenkonia ebinurensis]|uniref:SAF domain-containing protein n=1 Tax=Nesterenkonia ebinurensis TaxID=2608252 RepID=UPI00123D5E5E|nr:SAF domain-containing protein [Nesterenkonia ebinurensis]
MTTPPSGTDKTSPSAALSAGALQAPTAARLRRPSWRDPRLLAGALLILASVVGTVLLVTAQDRTAPVYAADRGLSTGTSLSQEDLRIVHVRLDESAAAYLSAEAELPENAHLIRAVGEGELLPAAALAERDPHQRQPVTVEIQHELARAVEPGRLVDVWAAGGFSGPEAQGEVTLLAASAEVADIREPNSGFGASGALTVELLVDPEELTGLLTALGGGDSITVLPAGVDEQ